MGNNPIPDSGFLRLKQILGDPKKNIPAIIPISRSAWFLGVKSGIYPSGLSLSAKVVVYRAEDIRALLNRVENA